MYAKVVGIQEQRGQGGLYEQLQVKHWAAWIGWNEDDQHYLISEFMSLDWR